MNEQVNLKKISETEWFCAFKLPDDVYQYLWHRIEEAKKENEDHRENLAGNISHSLTLRDPNNKEGDLLIFPSFLIHQVTYHSIDELRVTVSGNVRIVG
jgi:hypothetical protein